MATWALIGIALACVVSGAHYASEVVGSNRVEPEALGSVIADATRATILLVLAGCAVIGLVVLRGVAEMLDQLNGPAAATQPLDGSVDATTAGLLDH